MPSTDRVRHLNEVLTGLAMFDAYTRRDADTLKALAAQIPPSEVANSLLAAMDVLTGIFAKQSRVTPLEVAERVRRRVIREIADTTPRSPRKTPS